MYLPLQHKAEIQALVRERSELSTSIPILEGTIFWMILGVIFFGVTLVWNIIGGNDVITLMSIALILPFIIVAFRKKNALSTTNAKIAEIDHRLSELHIQNVEAEEKIDPKRGLYYIYTVMMTGDEAEQLDPMENESYR